MQNEHFLDNKNKTPQHIAIIMDGNRRWARKNNLSDSAGHEEGMKNIENILNFIATNLDVKYVTLFAFSSENWNRSEVEIKNLKRIINRYLGFKTLNDLKKNNVKLRFVGNVDKFGFLISNKIKKFEKDTANGTLVVNIAMNYGARAEIVDAVNKAIELKLPFVDEKSFNDLLYFKGIPEPDLLIRTGGEKRLSNFLLWHLAYSELCFTNVMWPEFSSKDLMENINDFQLRDRRYGSK